MWLFEENLPKSSPLHEMKREGRGGIEGDGGGRPAAAD
jgi:hypothetical protein